VHSIYNNTNELLSKISSLNCKRKSLPVKISTSNSWFYITVSGVNIFSSYNNGDLLLNALETIQTIDAFDIQIKEATLTSSNSWVYLKLSGHTLYSFYNNTDLAIIKVEQYSILKDLFRAARNKCRITQANGWSYLFFGQSPIYSYYNNIRLAQQKLEYLTNLNLCFR
jgi:hypothetical protein